jgi:hypothetical protein
MRAYFCFALLLIASPSLFAKDVLTAEFRQDLSTVEVQLCFDGSAPNRLYRNDRSSQWSSGIYLQQQRLQTREHDGTVRLPALPDNSCIEWQVDLDAALIATHQRAMTKTGGDLIMSADVWFWRGPGDRKLDIRVKLPAGLSFSTPWKANGQQDGYLHYQSENTPPRWETKLAVGKFDIQSIKVPGAQLRLAVPGNTSSQQQQKFATWIQESATSVSEVIGRFPQADPQVLVIPSGNRGSAVLFGQVIRGGGMSVIFWVDESRPLREFLDGWTATHEFSHMLLPYITSRDRWLSEGLASYYQNVLRARSGRITERQAWQELYDGLERGRKGTGQGTLAAATRAGRASTMRVYWSGAALMLLADKQLRVSSSGQQSLDTALKALSECCLENGVTWQAKDMFDQLDSLTGTQIFSEIYQRYANGEGFPDLQNTWDELGINTAGYQISLEPDAPMADVREAIMKG